LSAPVRGSRKPCSRRSGGPQPRPSPTPLSHTPPPSHSHGRGMARPAAWQNNGGLTAGSHTARPATHRVCVCVCACVRARASVCARVLSVRVRACLPDLAHLTARLERWTNQHWHWHCHRCLVLLLVLLLVLVVLGCFRRTPAAAVLRHSPCCPPPLWTPPPPPAAVQLAEDGAPASSLSLPGGCAEAECGSAPLAPTSGAAAAAAAARAVVVMPTTTTTAPIAGAAPYSAPRSAGTPCPALPARAR
jgi:hypothetical protein